MTEYTDAELAAELCEQAAIIEQTDHAFLAGEVLRDAAARLRARSEDTERLDWLENASSFSAGTLRLGADPKLLRWLNARDGYTEQPTIRAAIDSARKRGE